MSHKHNIHTLAVYLERFTPTARGIVYNLLRRAPECGYTDSPNAEELEKEVMRVEQSKKNGK